MLSAYSPRTLWSKGNADDERDRPHPLESIWNAVCPLIGAREHGSNDTDRNELAKTPAAIDVGGEVATQSDGADF